ncbi:MAG: glycosyltransferase family 2 protein [Acidobacteria bacterium]|nr:glycosyltransferase family 2 protein [Acidobacteriota bacterium]
MEEQLPLQPDQEQSGPLATVIVASYRRGNTLRQCLQALEKSDSFPRLQVIVLDIANYDTTTQWDLDFPGITFLRMPRNFGATRALNIGIRSAQADLLLFLDPGVQVAPTTVSQLIARFEELAEGAVCPLLIDSAGNPVPQVRKLPERTQLWEAWQDDAGLPMSVPAVSSSPVAIDYPGRKALLIRRAFLKGMNYFDEGYGEWGGDLELAFQIRHAGRKALLLPDVKAVDHSGQEPAPNWSSSQRATLAADRLNGASHFLSKRLGFVAGTLIKLQALLVTLLRALTFQSPGYNWKLFFALIGGQKIDGSQGGV